MTSRSNIIVYTTGVYDLFHVGHLNMLKFAKGAGDQLIVGVSTDDLVYEYKKKFPHIPFEERLEIVSAIKYVDVCIPQRERDKVIAWEKLTFDIWVVGDDWFGDPYYMEQKAKLEKKGVKTLFFPYTKHVCSTERKKDLLKANIE